LNEFKQPTLEDRLAVRDHPAPRPVGFQRWNDLLFLHWKIAPELVQVTLPPGLRVDVHEGAAYVGIVPFFMERIRPAWLPPLPWVSWFLELNVRTYVHDREGHPGVWFYSLDCNQPLAVALARRFFHLPYFNARMRARRRGGSVEYRCERRGAPGATAEFAWRPDGAAFEAAPGSLEFFLVERYLLFSMDEHGALHCGRVHHRPYRIQRALVTAHSAVPARQAGFASSGAPDSTLCAGAADVAIYLLQRVEQPER
jgi:uncharacterized protein